MAVRRVRCRLRAGSAPVLADHCMQAQWGRPLGVAALRHWTYSRLASESCARSIALENQSHLILSINNTAQA